jgi:hypothetical protein
MPWRKGRSSGKPSSSPTVTSTVLVADLLQPLKLQVTVIVVMFAAGQLKLQSFFYG